MTAISLQFLQSLLVMFLFSEVVLLNLIVGGVCLFSTDYTPAREKKNYLHKFQWLSDKEWFMNYPLDHLLLWFKSYLLILDEEVDVPDHPPKRSSTMVNSFPSTSTTGAGFSRLSSTLCMTHPRKRGKQRGALQHRLAVGHGSRSCAANCSEGRVHTIDRAHAKGVVLLKTLLGTLSQTSKTLCKTTSMNPS